MSLWHIVYFNGKNYNRTCICHQCYYTASWASGRVYAWSKSHIGNHQDRVHTEHWKWFSTSFQDYLIEWISNKSDFHIPRVQSNLSVESNRNTWHNIQYVTQFTIILNNRSNRVSTMILYVKAKNMYTGQKCINHLVYFPWLSRT